VEPQRNFSDDGDQRWFEGGDWNRGRHGASADGDGAYHGAEAEYTGDVRGGYGDPAVPPPPAGSAPQPGAPEQAEAQRRTAEAIDVGAMRRPPVSPPPAGYPPPPAYGGGPEQPLYPASPAVGGPDRPQYPASPAVGGPDRPQYPASPGVGGPDRPLYPANPGPEQPSYPPPNPGPENYPPPHQVPGHGPLGAPTAAVHTIPPPRQAGHTHQPGPSVYQSRKPVVLVALIVLTVLFEIPALRLLASATLDDNVPANGVVAGTFLVLGIPVFAYGLYGVLGGGPISGNVSAWLRQPLIYVPLGVLLFLFAALAA
jgi:hypothetical protein